DLLTRSAVTEPDMERRNASVAVIGAGDYIGAAIARKFAAEGFTVFAGRRHGSKLAPLVAEIEAAGGQVVGRSLDARQEDQIAAFLREADAAAPLELCVFNRSEEHTSELQSLAYLVCRLLLEKKKK